MSFARYPTYKDSGVEWLGEVPGHWEVKRLKQIASHNDETLDESTDADFEILYVDISSVDPMLGITAKEAMPFFAAPSRARRKVRNGDAIVSTVRTYLRAIARITNPEDNLVVSTGFAVVRPSPQVHHSFLGYLLTAGFFVDEVISRSVGVSYPAINASDLMRIAVPVPNYSEQQAIATFLDLETAKIDGLMAEQRALMALLKEKRQAVISHAVTKGLNPAAPMKDSGVAWLGEVPGHWAVKRLKQVASHNDETLDDNTYADFEILYVDISSVDPMLGITAKEAMTFSAAPSRARRKVRDGDAIVSTVRTYLRAIARITNPEDNLVVSTGFAVIRPSEQVHHGFLGYLLTAGFFVDEVISRSAGVSYPAINASDLMRIAVPVPNCEEQQAISNFLNHQTTQLDTLTQEAQTAIALLQERRRALISAAVTGKMDIRKAVTV